MYASWQDDEVRRKCQITKYSRVFSRLRRYVFMSLLIFLWMCGQDRAAHAQPDRDLSIHDLELGSRVEKRQLLDRYPRAARKLRDKLFRLMERQGRLGSTQALAYAQSQRMPVVDKTVAVIAIPKIGILPEQLANLLSRQGGGVVRVGRGHVKVNVPPSLLESLATEMEQLDYVRLPERPHLYNSVISEGVGVGSWTNAQNWQDHNLKGAGIKVAVIDGGFIGLASRQAADEIPGSAILYDTTGTGMETDTTHGCAVAETVYDMAPEAQLYLIKVEDESDLEVAKDYCKSEGIDAINHSMGWYGFNFFDGVAYSSMEPSPVTIANDASANGILWMNSAGNDRQGHARIAWTDGNGDNSLDWTASGTFVNEIGYLSSGAVITVTLAWNDWPTSDQDFDLWLRRWTGSSWEVVAASEGFQTGTQPPTEGIYYAVTTPGDYGVTVRKYTATTSPTFILRSWYQYVQYYSYNNTSTPAGGSIGCPADADSVFAVGAIDEDTYRSGPTESYSSIGPTNGSYTGQTVLTKPDICGPDDTASVTYPSGFTGTSASSPHIAGAAALVWSRFPSYTNAQVRSHLEAETFDLGNPGKDSTYGHGSLVLTKMWTLTISSTAGGSVTTPGEGPLQLDDASVQVIVATADPHYRFVNWTGAAVGAGKVADPNAASTSVTVDADYNLQANFAMNQYIISGRVTLGGSGLADVNMVGLPGTPVTDANGNYAAQIDSGWSGIVTPSKTEYVFEPNSVTYTNVTSDYANEDYTAALVKYAISGRVTFDGSGLADVNMVGLGVLTDANGDYSAEVDSGWSGTVTPTKAGYLFEPRRMTYANVTAHEVQDYTAELRYPAGFEWTNAGYGDSWCTPENWEPDDFNLIGMLPGPNDTASFSTPARGPIVAPGCDVHVDRIHGPRAESDSDQVMDVNGGSIVVENRWRWGRDGTGTATLNISGSPNITIGGQWRGGDSEGGRVVLDISGDPNIIVGTTMKHADGWGVLALVSISGGTINVGGSWVLGEDGNSIVDISGGVIDVNEDWIMRCRSGSDAEINMTGGSLYFGGNIQMSQWYRWGIGTATINLSGGSIDANAMEMTTDVNGTAILNMTGGALTLADELAAPADALGTAIIYLDGGAVTCGRFTHAAPYTLDFAGGTLIIDGDVVADIESDVAFGYITAYGGTGVVVADFNQTNPSRTTVRGFGYFAAEPRPEDGTENLCPEGLVLSWKAGFYAAMHDVYLGTDFTDVNDANISETFGVYMASQSVDANSYDTSGLLEAGTVHYWRIDEVNGPNAWKGAVWSFAVEEGKTRDPDPEDGVTHVPADQILSWTPACFADSHDVYLGTDWDDVNDATTALPLGVYMGNQGPNTYDPCGLEAGLTYYWRVDEVNGPNTWWGNVWSFTVEDVFVVVDDMEPYDYNDNLISDTWLDGVSNGTGSAVSLGILGSVDPVHGGNRSMEFEYDNSMDFGSGYYSQIEANAVDLQAGSDWTVQGVRALTLWFYGNTDNDANAAEQMYVGLEDITGSNSYAEVRYGDNGEDTNDIKNEEWQEWNINLQNFTDVNVADVNKVYIGFGDRSNPTVPGGDGVVYFDDIRLYRVGGGIWIRGHSPSGYTIGPIDYVDVTFSSDVNESGFDVNDINMVGPSGPIAVSEPNNQGGNVWRVSFPEQSTQGEYHLYIGPHVEDANGNEMDQDADRTLGEDLEDIYDAIFVLMDSTPPTVISITRQTPAEQQTNAAQVTFAVVFSESVIGVQTNNFSIDATGDQVGATTQSVSGSDANWTVTVATVAGDGSLSVDLDQNISNITDLTELLLTEAFTSGESYDVDRTAPIVTLDSAAPDPTNISPIPVTAALSEASTDFTEADITPTNATISDFSGSAASYSFNLIPAGQGLVLATVPADAFTDAAGNGNVASAPLSRTEPSIDFASDDITPTNGTVSDFSGSGADYSFNLVPAGQGLVSATVQAGTFADAAGNINLASAPLSRTYDGVSPVVTSVVVVTGLSVDVTFSEPIGAGATNPRSYTLSGSGQGSLSNNPDTVWLQGGTTYRLTWYSGDMIGGGDITITVDNVYDPAGNLIGIPNSGTHVGAGIPEVPTVIYFNPPDGSRITTSWATIIVAFSEEVVGVDGSDMVLSGPAAAGAYVSSAAPSWQVENAWVFYFADLAEGTLNISLAPDAGDIEDLAGNDLPNIVWSYEVAFGQKDIYWSNSGYGKIERANTDGSEREVLIEGLDYPYGIAIDARAGKMYWTDPNTDRIQRADLEIPEGETPDARMDIEVVVTDLNDPAGIAVDPYNDKVYWTEPTTGRVRRANLDGSEIQDIVTDLNSPTGIAMRFRPLTPPDICWTDAGTGKVQCANLDGSDVEDVVTGLNSPTGIALQHYGGGTYLADFGAKKIRAVSGPDLLDLVTGLSGPWGIAANGRYDDEHMYLYWTDIESNKIQRVHNTGYGGAEDIITFGLSAPSGIAFYNEPLTYFVDADANGANNGTSWADAFVDLEYALVAALPGDEIWVAEGIYLPSERTHGNDPRTAAFWLRNEVALYGGYPSGGGTWEDRDPSVYETILSGDLAGDDIDVNDPCDLLTEPTRAENAYHVVYRGHCNECWEIYETAVLDGFVITGGNANGDPNTVPASTVAGGMRPFGRPTVRNCVFTRNSAIRAGVFIGDAIMTNCVFRENAAYTYGGVVSGDNPTLISCSFIRNYCRYMGGAFYGTAISPIVNCTFRENSAEYGGAISMSGCTPLYTSCPSIKNCTFIGNVAETAGGGIHCWQYILEVSNCILWGNMAPEGAQIANYGGTFDTATISYSNVQGGSDQVYILSGLEPNWAEGNIDLDPLLTPDGHLRAGSPCINLGDPNFTADVDAPHTPDLEALTDIDGEDRVMDGRMDIGSDEFLDSDGDGLPDWWERKYFGDPCAADPNFDADADGLANLEEYELYGSNPNAPPINVPTQYSTIQAALDAAEDGDTVLVASGTYADSGNYDLEYGRKSVIVRSTGGSASTTIDCGNMGQAVNLESNRGIFAALEGFTITNGTGDVGGGIRMENCRFMFKDCVVTGNTASDKAGGFYCSVSSPTLSNLTVQDNPAPNEPNAGLIEFSNISLQGNLAIETGTLDVYSSWFGGPGQIYLAEGTLLRVTPTTPVGRAGPTVIRTDVNGLGDIEIDAGQQLIIEGDAVVNLSGSSECNPDANTGGFITVDGSLVIRGNASLLNTNVDVKLCEFGGNNNIQFNNVLLLETSEGFGGQFYVSENATIYCNTIISEGDRYFDLDPDPSNRNFNISDNRIIVIIKEGTEGSQGTLLELRAADYDCGGPNNPYCKSGAYQVSPNSPGFTEDPSENWVLKQLVLEEDSKLNLTNRQGFEFQDFSDPNIGDWEAVYVKELVMGPNAVLNTAFQTLYYQRLVDQDGNDLLPADPNDPFVFTNGSRFEDTPLLGFSLSIIAMDDSAPSPHNEFDIRVRRRIRDPNDIQPEEPDPAREGSVERIDDDPAIPVGAGGVMEMRTQAPGLWSANSVAAKGAFARAGDENIKIEFEYMFLEDPYNQVELVVYLSDDPEVSENLVEVARIVPPNEPNQPGWIDSGQFALFSDSFPRGSLNFNRGTYIELELRGTSTRCWIDNWDPSVGQTVSYYLVDDMESYNDSDNRIWDTWIDGFLNGTGSWVNLASAPTYPVHGGEKSMWYDYDNHESLGGYSEAYRVFADPCDWAVLGARALSVWFYGDAGNNGTEQMYVGLEDSSGAGSYAEARYGDQGEDMNNLKVEEWQRWNVALTDFSGLNLSSIQKIYIGFGDRSDPVPGGSGTVYFDDIYVYEPICIHSERSAAFASVDLSGDCVIDLRDLRIMANNWLEMSVAVGDLYKDKRIDFKDYTILSDKWLDTEGLWP
ncbi:MAG: S8 family serine peptidase [Planctomycetota bacterium]|jgi:predicted outer membrane repeat protein